MQNDMHPNEWTWACWDALDWSQPGSTVFIQLLWFPRQQFHSEGVVPENIHTFPQRIVTEIRRGMGVWKRQIFEEQGGRWRVLFPECLKCDRINTYVVFQLIIIRCTFIILKIALFSAWTQLVRFQMASFVQSVAWGHFTLIFLLSTISRECRTFEN